MTSNKNTSFLPLTALIFVQLIFGFNYAASKVILVEFPPLFWAGLRIFIAAILMFVCSSIWVPKEQRRLDKDFLLKSFWFGLIGIAINQAFFLLGLKHTTIVNAAILNTLTPVFTLLFAIFAKAEKWNLGRGIGFGIAVLGVVVLRNIEDFHLSQATLKGDVYTVLNAATLALFFAMSRDFLKNNSALWATTWMFFFAAIVLFVTAIPDFLSLQPITLSSNLIWAMAYNIVGATMITYFLNSWTLKKVNSSSVSLFIYFQPIIAVVYAWAVNSEVPTPRILIAMTCIFLGVGLGVLWKK